MRAAKVTATVNPAELERAAHGLEVRAWTLTKAEEAAQVAQQLAPYPRIADSIHAEETPFGAALIADDWISGFYELGTVRQPASPFLRPAVATVLPAARMIEGPPPA
jgi:hypothetical protein